MPGEAFGTEGYLRLSYALGDDDLVEGVERIAAYCRSSRASDQLPWPVGCPMTRKLGAIAQLRGHPPTASSPTTPAPAQE